MNATLFSEISKCGREASVLATKAVLWLGYWSSSLRQRLQRFGTRLFMRFVLILIAGASWIGRRRRPIDNEGCEIMVTGRFDSQNWILAHLVPLAKSSRCSRLWMVSTNPVPSIPKVEAIYPPKWLVWCIGATPSRLLTFLWAALRKRPHIVGGFHLIYNGIMAAIAGRLAGARCLYFCVGGTEVDNEGIEGQDNCFMRTLTADAILRELRLRIVSTFDVIITMGTRAAQFFKNNDIHTKIYVVSGGIDAGRFCPGEGTPSWDVILVARLSPEKRVDVFLQAVRLVVDKMLNTRVVIIGDGGGKETVQSMARRLDLNRHVKFAGHQEDIANWLRAAKVFALTSDLEGLALSVIEAMMCGLPAVVSDVGDLADVVENGVNGYLVPRRRPELFAECLVDLLADSEKLQAFSRAARRSALRYETQATVKRWDAIIAEVAGLTQAK